MFWKNKKVLITGHTGFKGSWLSLWLSANGANVTGYSISVPTTPSLYKIANISEYVNSIRGDIRDFDKINQSIKEFSPEIIFHLAAQPLVRYSYQNPLETFEVNAIGTVNILEAARVSKSVRSIVCITTDKCYENKENNSPFKETDPLGGHDPYSSSKACAELIASSYRSSFFSNTSSLAISLATARAGNAIGGGDWGKERIVPDIMGTIFQNRPLFIRNPHAVRPWQHVLEPLNGYIQLAEKLYKNGKEFAEAWNFGPEESMNVEGLVTQLIKLSGKDVQWKKDTAQNPHEASSLYLDITKAKKNLKWHPKLSLNEALKLTVDWYKSYYEKDDMNKITLNQINQFQKL